MGAKKLRKHFKNLQSGKRLGEGEQAGTRKQPEAGKRPGAGNRPGAREQARKETGAIKTIGKPLKHRVPR